jgi:hypothetical protein
VSLVCARETGCSVFVGGDRCAVRLEETEKISGGFPFCPVQSSQVNGRSDHDLGATKFEVPGCLPYGVWSRAQMGFIWLPG